VKVNKPKQVLLAFRLGFGIWKLKRSAARDEKRMRQERLRERRLAKKKADEK